MCLPVNRARMKLEETGCLRLVVGWWWAMESRRNGQVRLSLSLSWHFFFLGLQDFEAARIGYTVTVNVIGENGFVFDLDFVVELTMTCIFVWHIL